MPQNGAMDLFGDYRRELAERDLAPTTRQMYATVLRAYEGWLDGREPTPATLQTFLSEKRQGGFKASSVAMYAVVLKGFHSHWGQDTRRVKVRQVKGLPRYWDSGDIERLLAEATRPVPGQPAAVRERNYAIVLTLALGALRRSELTGLRVGDLDFRRRLLRVLGKGQKERVIPLAQRLMSPLWAQCQGKKAGDRVFPVTPATVYSIVTGLARRVGLEGFAPHQLRHWAATAALERGADVRSVQEFLGHADLRTTAAYLAISGARLRGVVDLLEGQVQPVVVPPIPR